jgi:hypothetical protein
MAHYAFLDENNIVTEVITGVDETVTKIDTDGTEIGGSSEAWETYYGNFRGQTCKRTSYNGNYRKNYAGIGFKYDKDFDAFIAPQPYPSWKLDYTTYQWVSPVPRPEDTEEYFWIWSEINLEWIQVPIE